MRVVLFCHSLLSDWNHGNAHFLRGIVTELQARDHDVRVYEPREAWSVVNLVADAGEEALHGVRTAYPSLHPTRYDERTLDLDEALDGADLVLVHEWNPPSLVGEIGRHKARGGRYVLLFHDTHHRSVSAPHEMAAYHLDAYDGVLAFGEVIRERYVAAGWSRRAWTWHEAADVRVFTPDPRTPGPSNPRTGPADPRTPGPPDPRTRPSDPRTSGPPDPRTGPSDPRTSGPPDPRTGPSDPRTPGPSDLDLAWVGNWGDEERSQEIRDFLIAPVRALGLRARVHGVRYPDAAKQALAAAGIEYAGWLPNYRVPQVFAASRVTVHIPRRPYVEALPGVPTIRMFEALACGIPLVSCWWNDSEGLFRGGRDYLMARTPADMTAALRAVLHDPGLAAWLARAGRETILNRHTCAHRVEELLAIAAGVSGRVALTV